MTDVSYMCTVAGSSFEHSSIVTRATYTNLRVKFLSNFTSYSVKFPTGCLLQQPILYVIKWHCDMECIRAVLHVAIIQFLPFVFLVRISFSTARLHQSAAYLLTHQTAMVK